MNALLLNGARAGETSLDGVQNLIVQELQARGGTVDAVPLCRTEIAYCLGCFGCWVKTPGQCTIDDVERDIARRYVQSDLVILLTPITFGGYSSELKKALDRLIPNISPFFKKIDGEVHHRRRYERYPRLVAVGMLAQPDPDEESERLFKTLVGRNAINMHAPAHAAGVVLAGQGPDEVRQTIQSLVAAAEVGR